MTVSEKSVCKYCQPVNIIKFGIHNSIQLNDWNDVVRYSNVAEPTAFEFARPRLKHRPHTAKQARSAYFRKAVRKSIAKKRKLETSMIPSITSIRGMK